MSEIFRNAMMRHSGQQDSNRAHPQMGLVSSYNPSDCTCRVYLQPENELTGWLPVMFPMVGPSIAVICPPVVGQQVLVAFEGGERDSGVVLGGAFSLQTTPPMGANGQPVQSGEIALVSGQGNSFFHMLMNGDILIKTVTQVMTTVGSTVHTINANGVEITGTVTVTGDVIANGISLVNHTHPYMPGSGGKIETDKPQG